MKSLKRKEDVQSTQAAAEGGQSYFLSIPETRTPWFFMNLDYADGFVHWVDIGGQARRVVCAGGLEGKGFAPDACPICSHVVGLYQEAKELREEGHTAKADKLKNKANRMRAKLEVQFKVIRGGFEIERDPKTRKKTKVVSFDTEDVDLDVAPGIIALSNSQFDGLTGLIKGEETPFIEVGDDLGTHYLVTTKERKKGRSGNKYSQVVWEAEEDEVSESPDVEIPKELAEINLEDNFQVDDEAISKVYGLLTGEESEDADDDEVVELEEDSVDEPDESYLDDVEGDDDEVEEDDDDDDEDEEEDEDDEVLEFEDDMPDEEPPKKKKASASKGASAKSTAKRSTAKTSGKSASKTIAKKSKSGKTRL